MKRNGNNDDTNRKEVYIVYMGAADSTNVSLRNDHAQVLNLVLRRNENALVRNYKHGFSGFAARLSKEEAASIAHKPGVVSVFPDPILNLHTTRSWEFLKYQTHVKIDTKPNAVSNSSSSSDIILGVLDTGIWPEAASFSDEGMGPVPSRWKGTCMKSQDFNSSNCNRKLIGARFYTDPTGNDDDEGDNTPRDSVGHGTHVASTAVGATVTNASYYGLAAGSATGGSSESRLAVYRVCSNFGCRGSAILGAFDDAISDGVDVLSLSLGASPGFQPDLTTDPIALGAFHAVERGILVVCSAGNSGPSSSTVVNDAPWILTVAASTIDRDFQSDVVLGVDKTVKGRAINFSPLSNSAEYPMIYGESAKAASTSLAEARQCHPDSLDANKVKGKIVVCDGKNDGYSTSEKIGTVKEAGGIGLVHITDQNGAIASYYGDFPATVISSKDGVTILQYINSTSNPVATILPTATVLDYKPAPVVPNFSSRGPSSLSSNILKPDIAAPGVNILAAWIENGTYRRGLVYETSTIDYLNFLCYIGFNVTAVKVISKTVPHNFNCPKDLSSDHVSNINYPSIAINFSGKRAVNVSRTVTNVGEEDETDLSSSFLLSWQIGGAKHTECNKVLINMKGNNTLLLPLFYTLLLFLGVSAGNGSNDDTNRKEVYIVYMGAADSTNAYLRNDHVQILNSVLKRNENAIVRNYKHGFSGFAARLSKEEANSISQKPGVVSVFPDPILKLHTTRSWDFLKSQTRVNIDTKPNTESSSSSSSDVILGILDTGIWPEAASFSDEGFGPVPSRWKGTCMTSKDFNSSNCNRKLIGARFYPDPDGKNDDNDKTPRDSNGHGTHVASTAVGVAVSNASFYGLATGTAKGGSPESRLAVYKVCYRNGCRGSAILAAFDDAIADGVDVLSLSLGVLPLSRPKLTSDTIAIGAFHAVQRGILVVCAAGNAGPLKYSVVNDAPWILTVAASTIDRDLQSNVVLGTNHVVKGRAINFSPLSNSPEYPMVYGESAKAKRANLGTARKCHPNSLDRNKVKGKIVICDGKKDPKYITMEKINIVKAAGGIGLAHITDQDGSVAFNYVDFPATEISSKDGVALLQYINSTSNPVGTILATVTVPDYKPAPVVGFFSSRGPSTLSSNILKPDIAAPGVNILAAWIGDDTSEVPKGRKPSLYNIISGTSMATPHVSGLVCSVKTQNPSWSASAIKSAIMTSAIQNDNLKAPITTDSGSIATPYDYGAGEITTSKPLQPGLVYETNTVDYLNYLCYTGHNLTTVKVISGTVPDNFNCPKDSTSDLISNINYPSIAVNFTGKANVVVSRTVTNLSLSLGPFGGIQTDLTTDPISIGAVHAVERSIVAVCAARNDGQPSTVVNDAPWILTVAASIIDRDLQSNVVLGNNQVIKGRAIHFSPLSNSPEYPMIYDPNEVIGKIAVYDGKDDDYSTSEKIGIVQALGGIGLAHIIDQDGSVTFNYEDFPATKISSKDGVAILHNPVGTILATVIVLDYKPAPRVVFFFHQEGLHCLQAMFSSLILPHRELTLSLHGLQMTHQSVKTQNPTWSASAIKSAIMTSAIQNDNLKAPITTDSGSIATPYDYGAGTITTSEPLQPGRLVYETNTVDYLNYLCYIGLNSTTIKVISGTAPDNFHCPKDSSSDLISSINYTSIAVNFTGKANVVVSRTITNVGEEDETVYFPVVEAPSEVIVTRFPYNLQFTRITFTPKASLKKHLFGSITWNNGKYMVRIPLLDRSTLEILHRLVIQDQFHASNANSSKVVAD
ncbi:CO(2)-response secreted protease [Glycine soja]